MTATTPTIPHSSHAGKYAPNAIKEGAAEPAQPVRQSSPKLAAAGTDLLRGMMYVRVGLSAEDPIRPADVAKDDRQQNQRAYQKE